MGGVAITRRLLGLFAVCLSSTQTLREHNQGAGGGITTGWGVQLGSC